MTVLWLAAGRACACVLRGCLGVRATYILSAIFLQLFFLCGFTLEESPPRLLLTHGAGALSGGRAFAYRPVHRIILLIRRGVDLKQRPRRPARGTDAHAQDPGCLLPEGASGAFDTSLARPKWIRTRAQLTIVPAFCDRQPPA